MQPIPTETIVLDERRRHRLIHAFEESHGEETAIALAESLFSTEFATKADLTSLETRLTTDIKALETRLTTATKALETRLTTATKAEIDAATSRQTRWLVTSMLAFLALVLTGGGIATTVLLYAINSATV